MSPKFVFVLLALAGASLGLPTTRHRESKRPVPPAPRYPDAVEERDYDKIASRVESWKPSDPENVWEMSGLYEGDIMVETNTIDPSSKNGLLDAAMRWPGGVVPFYIQEDDFVENDMTVIKSAIMEYHEKTCLRFRPYKETDDDYVVIQGKRTGCWSLVGRHGQGQVLNLQNPGCVRHGVVVHEIMHALGFYHQQSASDRDEWVMIHWDNIKPGKQHNFNKYDNRTVTDYGVGYDYGSVMHYSSHAFSRNGEPTITPLKEKAKLGQRKGLSKKDITKIQLMYKDVCENRESQESSSSEDISFNWIFD